MMKKMMFMAATAALVLASCSSDEPTVPVNSGKEISFRTNMDKVESKAALSSANTITNFSAFAFLQRTNDVATQTAGWGLMEENAVTRHFDGNWLPAKTKFWPIANNGYPLVHFVCYSPAGARNMLNPLGHAVSGSLPSLTYKVPTTNQVDFLIGTQVVIPNGSNDYAPVGPTAKVIIPFRHALSVVQFKAVNTSEDAIFVISEISLVNFKNSGAASITINTSVTPTSFSWSSSAYNQAQHFSEYPASIPKTGVSILYDPFDSMNEGELITTDNEGIIIMPQNITPPSGEYVDNTSGMFAKVLYYGMDRSGERFTIGALGADGDGVVTKYFPITSLSSGTAFKPNTKYVYKFTFNAGKSVVFDAPTTPYTWGEETIN